MSVEDGLQVGPKALVQKIAGADIHRDAQGAFHAVASARPMASLEATPVRDIPHLTCFINAPYYH